MNPLELQQVIEAAFRGVTLGGGVSLRQAEVMDNRGAGVTDEAFYALPSQEETDDWAALPLETLDEYPLLAYVDAEGFRFYIPAFLLSVLAHYAPGSLRVICALSSL